MDFTKGKRRAYERLMKEKPGFGRHKLEDGEESQRPCTSDRKQRQRTSEKEKQGKEDA
ncbi:hypothetical protein D3C74_105730 [compost metagenome]